MNEVIRSEFALFEAYFALEAQMTSIFLSSGYGGGRVDEQ